MGISTLWPSRNRWSCPFAIPGPIRGSLARNDGPRPKTCHALDRPPRGDYRFLPGSPRTPGAAASAPARDRPRHPPPPRALPPGVRRDRAAPGRGRQTPRVPLRGRAPITVAVQLRGVRRVQRRLRPGPGRLGPVRRRREPGRPHQRRPRGRPARRAGALRVLLFEAVRPVAAADLRRRRRRGTARRGPGRRSDRPGRRHLAGRHRRQGGVRDGPHGAPARGLGGDWSAVTAIDVYTVHPIGRLLPEVVLGRAGAAARTASAGSTAARPSWGSSTRWTCGASGPSSGSNNVYSPSPGEAVPRRGG